ncbi:MAG: ABC transporter permease [Turicibacter sp.]
MSIKNLTQKGVLNKQPQVVENERVKPSKITKFKRNFKKYWGIYLLLLPTLIYVFIYHYIPMYGVQIAFRDFSPSKGILESTWVGFKHFERFLTSYRFAELLKNTISLSVLTLIFSFPVPIILSLLLNQFRFKKYRSFIQTIIYAPNFITVVVLVGMLSLFLSPHTGVVNHFIKALGGDPIFFMGESKWFIPLYILSGIWQGAGFGTIIYLGALSGVSPELYEAAKIDGASKFQIIRNIDYPAIMPTVVIMFILAIGGIMNVGFEKVFLMQNDLNRSVTDIIATYTYEIGIQQAQYSYSAAIGLFNSVINAVLLIVANQISKKVSDVSLW